MDILNTLGTILVGFGYVIINFFSGHGVGMQNLLPQTPASGEVAAVSSATATTTKSMGYAYSQEQLVALATGANTSGSVLLGDYKYSTSSAKKGYVYLCNAHKGNPGSMTTGPWMHGTTWNLKEKVAVSGAVTWKEATFTNVIATGYRKLTGNDLPISHTTGVFPVASTDKAHQYDANPNTISAQKIAVSVPSSPTYSATPYCMGGEVGVMLTGVALFNAFDAGLRDAPAHELQDTCGGHPQGTGEYHYHSLPSCLKDTSVSTVIGFAYDGFPITGPVVAPGKYLSTRNLDECHGLTSEVLLDGKKTITYHYVMTYDFPYSASCFRGKPISTGVQGGAPNAPSAGQGTALKPGAGGTPPQQALQACSGKNTGASCSFTGGRGEMVSGTCHTPPGSALACVPS